MNNSITVLLPFYRPGIYFRDAIESVINQQYHTFELLLINNNSDEESVEVAKEFANHHPQVRLINESIQGISHALNTGLRHTNSEYIARMDADDICIPGRLQRQAQFLNENTDIGAVSGKVQYLCDGIENEGMQLYVSYINGLETESDIYNYRFVDTPLAHPSIMFRRSLIERFGYYSTDDVPEDFELWLRWFSNGVRIAKLPDQVIYWRDHKFRLSRINNNYSSEAFSKTRINYLVQHLNKLNHSPKQVYIWGTGKLAKQKVKSLAKFGIIPEGYIDVKPESEYDGKKVMHYLDLPDPGSTFIISLVSNRGKQKEVFDFLISRNYLPEQDFLIGS